MKIRVRNIESGQIEYVERPDSPRIEVSHREPVEPIRYYPDDLTAFYVSATVDPQPVRFYRPVPAAQQTNKALGVFLAMLIILVGVLSVCALAGLIAGKW